MTSVARVTETLRPRDAPTPPARQAARSAGNARERLQRQLGNSVLAALDGASLPEGRPLDPRTRTAMESRFGHDFGDVRIHDGPAAARSADELDAAAYTVGRDVVLGAGAFPSDTAAGQRVLAHELAHVAQQRQHPPERLSPSNTGAAEREAHAAAEAVGRGRSIQIGERLAPGAVARQQKGSSGRFPAAVESMTKEQILEIWKQSKDIQDFKLRLLGPVTDERLFEFLSRTGFNPWESHAEPEYAGPSIGPTPREKQIIGKIIYFTHPEGGTIAKYVRGTAEELDNLQDEENLRAAVQMAQGLMTGLAGVSAARAQGPPPATTERPRAAERRPAPPAAPAPTVTPRPPTRPARPLPPAPTTAPPTPTAPATAAPRAAAPPVTGRAGTARTSRPTQFERSTLEASTGRWQALRADALARDPTCPFCQARPSVTADHVEPLVDVFATVEAGMMTLEQARAAANHPSNLRGICGRCNSSKSGRPAGDSSVDRTWWTPPNPDQALIEHMRMMRRWPY